MNDEVKKQPNRIGIVMVSGLLMLAVSVIWLMLENGVSVIVVLILVAFSILSVLGLTYFGNKLEKRGRISLEEAKNIILTTQKGVQITLQVYDNLHGQNSEDLTTWFIGTQEKGVLVIEADTGTITVTL